MRCGKEGVELFSIAKYVPHFRKEHDAINDGSDAGRSGLRQLKSSLRPIDMHQEYRGSQSGFGS
jgi:hypothetical protein